MNNFFNFLKRKLEYKPNPTYEFTIEESNNLSNNDLSNSDPQNIFEKIR